jgi:hypothetical protein
MLLRMITPDTPPPPPTTIPECALWVIVLCTTIERNPLS